MGKLIFVNTNLTNGIFGVVICSVLIFGGAYATISGAYGGILAILLGLAIMKFCLEIATRKTEIYEQGFKSKSLFSQISGRYADQKSVIRSAVSRNAVLNTQIHFVAASGAKFMVADEALGGRDKKMDQLLDLACSALAEKWVKTLERQTEVVWLEKDDKPLLRIRKDGVLIGDGTGLDPFIPLDQLRFKEQYGLRMDILNGEKKILTVNSAESNFFVGQALVSSLLKKQSQAFGATTQG